jgi:hypothetical protein
MRLLVTGGRFWNKRSETYRWLDYLNDTIGISVLIHGDAAGADSLSKEWAIDREIQIETYPANWKQYGKKAGSIRNQQMIDEGHPDIVTAFIGGTGTNDMKNKARRAGLEVIEWIP